MTRAALSDGIAYTTAGVDRDGAEFSDVVREPSGARLVARFMRATM